MINHTRFLHLRKQVIPSQVGTTEARNTQAEYGKASLTSLSPQSGRPTTIVLRLSQKEMTDIRAVTAVGQLPGACFHDENPPFIPSHPSAFLSS